MSQVTAKFLGYQVDPRENCHTPWFVITVPDDYQGELEKWNGSTASINTLIKFGIDVPDIPKYIPSNFFGKHGWIFSCSVCKKSFGLDKIQSLDHIRRTKHAPVMEQVTIEEQREERENPSYSTPKPAIVFDRSKDKQNDTIPEELLSPDPLLEKHRKKVEKSEPVAVIEEKKEPVPQPRYDTSKEEDPVKSFRAKLAKEFPDLPFLKDDKNA